MKLSLLLRRCLPHTLASQLIAILLLGVLAAHLLALQLSGKQNGSIHQLALDTLFARYTTTFQALQNCTQGCDRQALLQAVSRDDASFTLQSLPPQITMSRDEQALAAELAEDLPAQATVMVQLEQPPRRTVATDRERQRVVLEVFVALTDGQWLQATLWPFVRNSWLHHFLPTLLASGLPILILVTLFTRRLLRPLRELSRAAEQLSRGEPLAPLAQSGPRELRELAQAFNTMQERLRRFVSDRTQMLAAISHDFRTPITSLRLRTELIDDDELRSSMARTLREMGQMMDETLRFACDDAAGEATSTIDLDLLLLQLAEERQLLGQPIHCLIPAGLHYRCRPLALKRALGNLLDNARRYGQHVELAVQQEADSLMITVADDGPGIAAEWLERVFEPFARPDADRNRDSGGVGLGLAIARSNIEAHGGTLSLSNRPQGGLLATVILPG